MRVSIVVPTFQRQALLARCLQALANQDFNAAEYEILVCDDAAHEGTRRFVEHFANTVRPVVRYLRVDEPHGPAAARNVGWRAARGAVVAFTDDDTVPDRGWLSAAALLLEKDPGVAAVAGQVTVPLPERPTDYQRHEADLERAEFVAANCFVRRSVLQAVDGFDERFRAAWREDSDLHFKLLEHGGKIIRCRKAIVVRPVPPAPWGVSVLQHRKCQFDALLYKKHPQLYRRLISRWPPLDYYGIVLAMVLGVGLIGAGLTGAATAAAAAGLLLWGRFLVHRLHGNTMKPSHVSEVVVTSAAIPFLSIFWRLYGAARFRVWFY